MCQHLDVCGKVLSKRSPNPDVLINLILGYLSQKGTDNFEFLSRLGSDSIKSNNFISLPSFCLGIARKKTETGTTLRPKPKYQEKRFRQEPHEIKSETKGD